jgi:O-antigen ligase
VGVILSLRYRSLLILAIPLGIGIAYSLANQAIGAEEYSWGTRLDAWKIVLEISKVSPLLGLGFSNYYWYTPLFSIRGWSVNFNSHSQYVDLIAQVGALGLFCFLWIFFELGRMSWKLSRDLPDGFARSHAYGVLAGILGSLVAAFLVDWILPFVYNIGFAGFRASILPWIFLGTLISVEQMYLRKTKI